MTPFDSSSDESTPPQSPGDSRIGAAGAADAFEPPLPGFIPVARPVLSSVPSVWPASMDAPPTQVPVMAYAGERPPRPRLVRAFLELIALVPAGFLGGMAGYLAARGAGVADEKWQLVASTLGMGAGALLAAAGFVFADRQKPADIGWTSQNFLLDIVIGIAALVQTYIIVGLAFIGIALLHPEIMNQSETARKAVEEMMPRMSIMQMALFMLFVSIWEEVVFRGFVLTRLKTLLGTWWLAVPVSSMVFGAIHLYEGPLAVAMITILGLVMAGLFIWRRSLVPCMTLHFLNNFLMLLVLRFEV